MGEVRVVPVMTEQELEAIRSDISNCATYNFGMRAADRLAHEGAPALLAEVFRLRALVGEPEWEYGEIDADELESDGSVHEWAEPIDVYSEPLSEDELAELIADGLVYIRRPRWKAGRWERVPETGADHPRSRPQVDHVFAGKGKPDPTPNPKEQNQ